MQQSHFALTFGTVSESEFYKQISFNSPYPFQKRWKYQFYAFHPTVAFGAGVDYKNWIYKKALLHLAMGWEFNYWFGLNRFGNPFDSSYQNSDIDKEEYFILPPTSIGYQGLVARAGLDY